MSALGWFLTVLVVVLVLLLLALYLVGRPMMKSVSHDDDVIAIEALDLPPRPPLAGSPAAGDQAIGAVADGRGVSSLTLVAEASAFERASRPPLSREDTQ